MKLLICDDRKMIYYTMPNNIHDIYVINYKPVGFSNFETISLECIDNTWNIKSGKNIEVYYNNQKCDKAPIVNYAVYPIKFFSLGKIVFFIALPDVEEFEGVNSSNTITIGSDPNCNIQFLNTSVLPNHACINNGVITSSKDALVYVNKRRVSTSKLKYGDVVFINGLKIIWMPGFMRINKPFGNSVKLNSLTVVEHYVVDEKEYTETTESEKNISLYNENELFYPTPKLKSYIVKEKISIEPPPSSNYSEKSPIIIALGSSIVMGLTSCITIINAIGSMEDNPTQAILELIAGVAMIVSSVIFPVIAEKYSRVQEKKKEKKKNDLYKKYLNSVNDEINQIIKKQSNILIEKYIDLTEIKKEVVNRGYNYWSRELLEPEFLSVRLGIGSSVANIELEYSTLSFTLEDDELNKIYKDMIKKEHLLENVPVTISLLENKVTPIILSTDKKKAFIDNVMLQLLFYYSSLDLKIVVLTNKENDSRWNYMKYVPHIWGKGNKIRYYGSNEKDVNNVCVELEKEYDKRIKSAMDGKSTEMGVPYNKLYTKFNEYYLIITDDFKSVKDKSIIEKIIGDTSVNCGFSLLVFSEDLKNVPSRFDRFAVIESNSSGIYNKIFNESYQSKFQADYFDDDITSYSKFIANTPLSSSDNESNIPINLSFLEMFNVGKIEHLNITSRWKENDPTTSLSTILGFQGNDKPIYLDLHEKAHGPHGLIAGSTGSGKSEFIITYILSMCVNYHPYEVQFVLIDYKGGGLAGAFEKREKNIKIPHLVGTITNLDKSEMNRTLVSIKSELERRQRKFNEVRDALNEGTIDIYKYQRLYREGKISEPISHLIIISDEFAELKQQQPEFMDELVSTARIGRSLGVHLILATQKPSGVVDDQIWSNSRFKVCLKVQTVEDSNEMLKREEASSITNAGRFYLQVGNNEIFELGQSGWAGEKYIPMDHAMSRIDDSLDFVNDDGSVIRNVKEKNNGVSLGEQLTNIVQNLYDIAIQEKIKFSSLWLPSIPENIYVGNLIKKYQITDEAYNFKPLIGEYDKPIKQKQGAYRLDINCKNSALFGMAGCGKENFITTLIFNSCMFHSIDEVNFYIVDFGSQALSVFNKFPHVGDYINQDNAIKVKPLFDHLSKQVQVRKKLFADYQGSYNNYIKSSDNKLPLIVTVINSYENFVESSNESCLTEFSNLLREGSKFGIVFIVSTIATNSIRSSTLDCMNNKIMLQVADPYDYKFFLGAPDGLVPKNYFGRGLSLIEGDVCEFQTSYICIKDKINDYLKEVGKKLYEAYQRKAPDIKTMPKTVDCRTMSKYPKGIDNLPIGFFVDDVDLATYNISKSYTSIISSSSIVDNSNFFCSFIDILDTLPNVKVNVIDLISLLGSTDGQNYNYYNSDYEIILNEIINYNDSVPVINVIVGIGNLENVLGFSENTILENILNSNIPNNYFILCDDESKIAQLSSYSWYDKVINTNRGLWLGKDIEYQKVFAVNEVSDYEVETSVPNKVFIINGKDHYMIRGAGEVGIGDDFFG